ncbi:hypothetical protein LOTGIDRAFT_214372 [Lottia gigantea]|uniref:Uncharacterized protein n=1 Tax=Lottia gigantea TaxID=225164 RepID=V4AIM6_LOTGI|nr:hypothetical protein LOTGIDRAFT_214372 [Lottia gigantea]ESO96837.1 hypothetical protein LOTGIDRAFT_214372 [Lottia gigantea]
MIIQASKQGYSTLVKLSSRGISYATNVFMKTALTGHGKLVDHLRRSYSTSDLSDDGTGLSRSREMLDDYEEDEDELDNRLYEDNREIEARKERRVVKTSDSKKTEKSVKMKKGTSTNAELTSVMEVDEDDEEVVVTEEITYIPVTRKHYTHKEQKQISKYGTLPKSYGRTTRSTRKPVHKEF